MIEDERAAMAAERKAFSREVVERVLGDFLAAVEEKAERLRRDGRWGVLDQARLDGLRTLFPEIEDFSLPFLSDLSYEHGLHIEFALVDRKEGIQFRDNGTYGPDGVEMDPPAGEGDAGVQAP